ncbi:MAG: DNA recombination protein RmuC [Chloroflexota bacterium]
MEVFYPAVIGLLVVILGVLLYLAYGRGRPRLGPQEVKAGILESLRELKLDEAVGAITSIGGDMKASSEKLVRLFEIKRERAAFGEWQLEELLKDSLGRGLFGIREELPGIGTPDAHIRSAEGIICLDCKFPLENYRSLVETPEGEARERAGRAFRRDVTSHVAAVAKYVCPEQGTVPFAFLFVPAESVYQYLAQEEPALLQEASRQGVIMVSPATLYAGLHLVKLGIRGKELTERGQEIEQKIDRLRQPLEKLGRAWEITRGHLLDAYRSKDEVDRWYGELAQQHQRVVISHEEDG